jgi:hypothetical protein
MVLEPPRPQELSILASRKPVSAFFLEVGPKPEPAVLDYGTAVLVLGTCARARIVPVLYLQTPYYNTAVVRRWPLGLQ